VVLEALDWGRVCVIFFVCSSLRRRTFFCGFGTGFGGGLAS
jgi:hypothetical protein